MLHGLNRLDTAEVKRSQASKPFLDEPLFHHEKRIEDVLGAYRKKPLKG